MIEFYPQIKSTHIALALTSGALFAVRGAGVLTGWQWPRWRTVRIASYGIDTCLLTSALMLFSMLPRAMFANGWIVAKLLLLVGYIVLGIFALRLARTVTVRAGCYFGALALFALIYSIARHHHPLGILQSLFG